MAAVCFQIYVIQFLGFRLFMISKLGHLLICVICVASPSGSHNVGHIMCITLFVVTYCVMCMCHNVFLKFIIFAKYDIWVNRKM